jgi:hypothetical protein
MLNLSPGTPLALTINVRNKGFIPTTVHKTKGAKKMKSLSRIGILMVAILVLAGSYFNAFAFTGALVPTAPVSEPVLMILLGTGLMALANFGRKWK